MKRLIFIILAVNFGVSAFAPKGKKEGNDRNRAFKKGNFRESEIDYRKAVLKDSVSIAAQYNLASSLYRQEDFDGASKALSSISDVIPSESLDVKADYYFNQGDVALASKDYASAVKSFRQSLLLRPDDMDAKENYAYAKKMLQNQENQGGQNGDNNQQDNQDNQSNDDSKNNQDNQNDQSNQNQPGSNDDKNDQNGDPQEGSISRQQARQMLNAIQAKEKETQDKVRKEKAEMMKSRQKEKNW